MTVPTASIAIITPSRPDRGEMLAELVECVRNQTLQPSSHLIGVDHDQLGPAVVRNKLIYQTSAEWLAFVDDDDLIDPDHLERLYTHSGGCDVVIPYCRFDGPPLPLRYHNRPYDRRVLRKHGIFPITVLARREAVVLAGGFPTDARYEDWVLWNTMADMGYRFQTIPYITWSYRTAHQYRRTLEPK